MQILNRPQAVIFEDTCRQNIKKLVARAGKNNAACRPHFKTHQSHEVGKWFKDEGVSAITVSTPDMARYFSRDGWTDITIAFPFYKAQIQGIKELSSRSNLRLFVKTQEDCRFLSQSLNNPVDVMIEIDAGYNRSGISYLESDTIDDLINSINRLPLITFKGFYIHDGGTYGSRGKDEVYHTIQRDLEAFRLLHEKYPDVEYGLGDTPSCSLIDDLTPATELSPGNLIFYDLMQIEIGSCSYDDIGMLVRVPVVQEKPGSDECIVHGGAVHFSKERLSINGNVTFGQPVLVGENGGITKIEGTSVTELSQEHGTVSGLDSLRKAYNGKILDEIWICPVHSCLTANLFDTYMTPNGRFIDKRVLS